MQHYASWYWGSKIIKKIYQNRDSESHWVLMPKINCQEAFHTSYLKERGTGRAKVPKTPALKFEREVLSTTSQKGECHQRVSKDPKEK